MLTGDSPDLQAGYLLEITEKEFQDLARLVYQNFGIHLTEKKVSLVRGRLNKTLKARGFLNFKDYIEHIKTDTTGVALMELVDKISTNHTYFFREADHFDFLVTTAFPEIIPLVERSGQKDIRLWCAGCATGEEPYTIAIAWNEFRKTRKTDISLKILATDISLTALETAQAAIYETEKLSNMPKDYLQKYFVSSGQGKYTVNAEIQKMILFKRLNLMSPQFPFKNQFHFIFCRNVMIYFDKPTKDELIRKFHKHLMNEQYLFIGHSESLGRDFAGFRYIQPSLYRRYHV